MNLGGICQLSLVISVDPFNCMREFDSFKFLKDNVLLFTHIASRRVGFIPAASPSQTFTLGYLITFT